MKKIILLLMVSVFLFLFSILPSYAAYWTYTAEILRIQQRTGDITITILRDDRTVCETHIVGKENESNILMLALTAFSLGSKVKFEIDSGIILQMRIHSQDYDAKCN